MYYSKWHRHTQEKEIRVLKGVSSDFETQWGGLKKRDVAQVLFFFLTSFEVFRTIVWRNFSNHHHSWRNSKQTFTTFYDNLRPHFQTSFTVGFPLISLHDLSMRFRPCSSLGCNSHALSLTISINLTSIPTYRCLASSSMVNAGVAALTLCSTINTASHHLAAAGMEWENTTQITCIR